MTDSAANKDIQRPEISTSDGNETNDEKSISFEEFRTMYESYRREIFMKYKNSKDSKVASSKSAAAAATAALPTAAHSTTAPLPTADPSAEPRRFVHGIEASHNGDSRNVDFVGLAYRAVDAVWGWMTHDWTIYLRVGVATLMLYGSLSIVGYLSVFAFYVVFSLLNYLFQSFHIRSHEQSANLEVSSPTVLGKFFIGNSPSTRVLPLHVRFAYIVVKSIEAFIISVSPSYSLEKLEKGLQRDGIVRTRQRWNEGGDVR
ncbi:unnamed protein product [Phytomonas sp. EM1]|nr:unnamed protein product [Phytomonas sp. EM1]|eukprot:CCW65474.1 unnamed protein product [Phytomonas sp. isolate EM1]